MSGSERAPIAEVELGLTAAEPGPRVPAPFGRRACTVVGSRAVGAYRLLGVEDPSGPAPLAGQFYMLSAVEGWGSSASGERPFLARALSVCRVRERRLDFLLDPIGPGTERLTALAAGEQAWLVGPLGIGFDPPEVIGAPAGATALLVGGGIGAAPLVIWAEALTAMACPALTLLGFRSARWCGAAELFPDGVELATDDGSSPAGVGARRGLVTELFAARLDGGPCAVYACGPPAMLEAVRRLCAERGVPGQLALEAGMACGFGACFGCVVATRSGYRRLCVDGPVVAVADLAEGWDR